MTMEWTKPARIPLTLILYSWIVPVAAHVQPPTNVTLHCHNFRNVLYWNYTQASPQLKFKVLIGAISSRYDPVWVDSPNLSADLSFLRDPKDDYRVTVTAVMGQNTSATAPPGGIKFSYFIDSVLDRKCSVDLPPVNVTLQPDSIQFSFQHPSLFYHQRSPTKPRRQKKHQSDERELAEFTYHVVTNPQMPHKPHHFICTESVCEDELPVDEEQKTQCLRIYGQWEHVAVRATQEYCTLPQADRATSYIPVYIVIGVLILAVIGSILFMVFRKKTQGHSYLPNSMKFPGRLGKKFMGGSLTPESTQVLQVQTSPTDGPLLTTNIGEESMHGDTPVDDVFRLPIGVQDGSTSGGTEGSVETQNSGYMSGKGLDGDAEEGEIQNPIEDYGNSSGYERRSRLVTEVEIMPGEKVEGYHG